MANEKTAYYPATGFHFRVSFIDLKEVRYDLEFQSVSGLDVQIETESIKEGGENGFEHVVPVRRKYSDLTLKRGVVTSQESEFMDWCRKAFAGKNKGRSVEPKNLNVILLNEEHQPLITWKIVHAWPKSWKYSELNAEKGEILIETLELTYNRFSVEGRLPKP